MNKMLFSWALFRGVIQLARTQLHTNFFKMYFEEFFFQYHAACRILWKNYITISFVSATHIALWKDKGNFTRYSRYIAKVNLYYFGNFKSTLLNKTLLPPLPATAALCFPSTFCSLYVPLTPTWTSGETTGGQVYRKNNMSLVKQLRYLHVV